MVRIRPDRPSRQKRRSARGRRLQRELENGRAVRGIEETVTMEEPEDLRRATELWQEAYRHQMEGELDRAMERYQRSIDV